MNRTKISIAAAVAAAAGALVLGGTAMANAASTPTPSASSSATAGNQNATPPAPHAHTAVTGDELAKVTAAVKAKDAAVTITTVEADPDGSYDVHGTKDGGQVMVEVSKDLKTIEVRTGGPGGHGGKGGHGGPGGASADTPVTGADADKVIAAVKAKDATVTVTSVRMDPDGSYDALGTKDGAPVMVEVSKDLKTIEVRTGGPGDHGAPAAPAPSGGTTSSATPSASSGA